MVAMQNMMDRMFNEVWQPVYQQNAESGANMLALDVDETDNAYTVTTAMPGVNPEHIQVKLEGNTLFIHGEIPQQTVQREGQRSLMRERTYGTFSRRIQLPQPVNREAVEASYENGVLTLTLPKSNENRSHVIPVRTGGQITSGGSGSPSNN
jgi:HSP20 family protein